MTELFWKGDASAPRPNLVGSCKCCSESIFETEKIWLILLSGDVGSSVYPHLVGKNRQGGESEGLYPGTRRNSGKSNPAPLRLVQEEVGGADVGVGMTELCFLGMSV